MEPAFRDGDFILIETVDPTTPVAVGDVVVARHPFKNLEVIKTVGSVDPDGHVRLTSPSGDDSRRFGRVPLGSVRGRVTVNLSRRAEP